MPGHHTRATEVNQIDKNPHPGDLVSVDNGETRAINNIYNKSGNHIYLESVECYGKTKTKLSNGGRVVFNKVNKIALAETALSERSSKCIHSSSPLPTHSLTHSFP